MVKKLMAILMSAMMLFSALPLDTAIVEVQAVETTGCSHILTEADIAKLPEDFWKTHSHEEYAVGSPAFIGIEVPAGCEEDGWHIEKTATSGFCMLCGEVITEGDKEVDPAVGHKYNDDSTIAATCEENGSRTCINNNYTLKVEQVDGIYTASLVSEKCDHTEIIPAIGHDYELDESLYVAPTCTEEGANTYVCKNDSSHIKVEKIPAIEHDYELDESLYVAPTCTEEGSNTYVCKNDSSHTYDVVVPATGHDYEETIVQEASCYNPGTKLYTCKNCGDSYTEEIPQLEHTGLEVTLEPTCTDSGKAEGVCELCGRYVVESIEPLGHDLKAETVEPTCTEDGYTIYTCQREGCDFSYIGDYKVKLGHDYIVDTSLDVTINATCEEAGSITHYEVCSRCDDTRVSSVDEIPALGHDYQIDESLHVDPTCTAKGSDTYVCLNDNTHTYDVEIPATGHDYYISEQVNPTCTESGRNVYTCKTCGDAFVEYVPALGHDVEIIETIDSNCVHGTITIGICQRCDKVIVEEQDDIDYSVSFISGLGFAGANGFYVEPVIGEEDTYYLRSAVPMVDIVVNFAAVLSNPDLFMEFIGTTGHDYYNYNENQPYATKYVPAACDTDGYWIITCGREEEVPVAGTYDSVEDIVMETRTCAYPDAASSQGHELKIINANSAFGHTWKLLDDENSKAPTCGEDGYRKYICLNDHAHTYTEVIPATGEHKYITEHVEATCITPGKDVYTCTVCGDTYSKTTTPAKGHSYVVTDKVAATCEDEGYEIYTCQECGDTYNKITTPAKGHQFTETGYTAPTCEEQGIRIYTCVNCEKTYNSFEPALGHNYGKVDVIKATCAEEGYTLYTCTNPGCTESYKTEITAKIDHVLSIIDQKAPTCAEDGYEIRACANCEYTETKVLSATGNHVYDSSVTKAATCTEDGVMTYTCQECGQKYTEVIPAVGHNFGKTEVVEATCTEEGHTVYTCTNPGCTESYQTDITDKAVHVLSVVDQKDATCTSNGYITRACANCDYTETEVLSATGHIFDDEGVNTPATCEKEGYTTYTCAVCGEKQVVKTSEKLGHVYKTQVSVAGGLNKTGTQTEVCVHCGKTIVSNTITAIKSVTLSQKRFAYTGRKVRPLVTVKDVNGKTISTKYYTVTYANNKKIGTATATIKFKGLYSGTVVKTFKIVPKGVGISKAKASKKSIKFTWGRVKNCKGYKLQYSTSKNFKNAKKVTIKTRKTCVYNLNNLTTGKTYYIRIRAYKKVGGKTYYGDWSSSSIVCK